MRLDGYHFVTAEQSTQKPAKLVFFCLRPSSRPFPVHQHLNRLRERTGGFDGTAVHEKYFVRGFDGIEAVRDAKEIRIRLGVFDGQGIYIGHHSSRTYRGMWVCRY